MVVIPMPPPAAPLLPVLTEPGATALLVAGVADTAACFPLFFLEDAPPPPPDDVTIAAVIVGCGAGAGGSGGGGAVPPLLSSSCMASSRAVRNSCASCWLYDANCGRLRHTEYTSAVGVNTAHRPLHAMRRAEEACTHSESRKREEAAAEAAAAAEERGEAGETDASPPMPLLLLVLVTAASSPLPPPPLAERTRLFPAVEATDRGFGCGVEGGAGRDGMGGTRGEVANVDARVAVGTGNPPRRVEGVRAANSVLEETADGRANVGATLEVDAVGLGGIPALSRGSNGGAGAGADVKAAEEAPGTVSLAARATAAPAPTPEEADWDTDAAAVPIVEPRRELVPAFLPLAPSPATAAVVVVVAAGSAA